MTRIKKLSTMLIAALALSAIILTGGALGPNAPTAEAAATPQCNGAHQIITYTAGGNLVATNYTVPVYKVGSSWSRTCLIGPNTAAQNEGVRQLQRSANLCYGRSLQVDGTWGPNTAAAIKHIQTQVGLTVSQRDGVYGPQTHNGSSGVSASTGMSHHLYCNRDSVNA
ncbi:MAG: peptidoglycan-binding protein [Bifidobacteriaceae bacterium]|jgi:peptidoglycan hydrolase-like protein with peptidoglycan-binding domain|nr:peptidoglycan-binding protein [Bifidobacteriaceae bacterium]